MQSYCPVRAQFELGIEKNLQASVGQDLGDSGGGGSVAVGIADEGVVRNAMFDLFAQAVTPLAFKEINAGAAKRGIREPCFAVLGHKKSLQVAVRDQGRT